ncbi:MAG: histidine phosphatase family protein [Paraburkholderia sp.]|nr:histidine phosphatase family protein [Paraburkholderia sp.]
MNTQILFIRHGETDWNRIKRIQGHIDIPLAESGVAQAQQLGARLVQEVRAGAQLDAIWSSDLLRAQQTAQPIAAALGLPVQLTEGLRERNYGAFQGHDSDEIAERFPDEYAHWQTRDPGFAPPEGESQREFYHRVLHALEPILAMHPGGRIACVAHGGVLDCLYRAGSRLPLEAARTWVLGNATINRLLYSAEGLSLVGWNDDFHLENLSLDEIS